MNVGPNRRDQEHSLVRIFLPPITTPDVRTSDAGSSWSLSALPRNAICEPSLLPWSKCHSQIYLWIPMETSPPTFEIGVQLCIVANHPSSNVSRASRRSVWRERFWRLLALVFEKAIHRRCAVGEKRKPKRWTHKDNGAATPVHAARPASYVPHEQICTRMKPWNVPQAEGCRFWSCLDHLLPVVQCAPIE